jgi:hypothetical protein
MTTREGSLDSKFSVCDAGGPSKRHCAQKTYGRPLQWPLLGLEVVERRACDRQLSAFDFALLGSCLHLLTCVVSLWAMLVCPEPSDTYVSLK